MRAGLRHLAWGSVFAVLATGSAHAAVELHFMCYGDGNECAVSRQILDGFEKANPDIKVTVDTVPYKAILESLPVQLAAGSGPDHRSRDRPGRPAQILSRSRALTSIAPTGRRTSATRWTGSVPGPTTRASTA